MSNNTETINAIQQQSSAVLEMLADRQIRSFKIKDLNFDNGVYLNDMPLRGRALKTVLSMLKVRTGFVDYSTKMTLDDWKTVSRKITAAEGDTAMFAKITKDDKGISDEVTEVFVQNDRKKHVDDASYRQYMNWITDSLANSDTSYSLKNFHFDPRQETMELILLNNDRQVDVFGTDTDVWKLGDRFIFNSLKFDYAPFFERLVCSNGNTATEYGFGAYISQAKFNNNKIKNVIERSILHGSEAMPQQLQKSVQHLKDNNVSLAEFYNYRRFFESRNSEGSYGAILENFFNDELFYKNYGVNIAEKSYKWKSTANSGINAYDFFNMLTWIASHPEKVRVSSKDRTDLQIQASHLLFKNQLDLEDVATSVNFVYPRLAVMN